MQLCLREFPRCTAVCLSFSCRARRGPKAASIAARSAAGLAASGAIVFGVQRLVPTYDHTWYMGLKKPFWNPPNCARPPLLWSPPLRCRSRPPTFMPAVRPQGCSPRSGFL